MKSVKQLWCGGALIVMGWALALPVRAGTNILTNGDLELLAPAFWSKWNEGLGGAQVVWATDAAHTYFRSFKVVKPAVTAEAVGWVSVNNADLYWNNAGDNLAYQLTAWMKTAGVNTSPTTDDARIGVWFKGYKGGVAVFEELLAADQSVGTKDWHEVTSLVQVPSGSKPDSVVAVAYVGKAATGTVWFDDIDFVTSPNWTASLFNGTAETPVGWMFWTASPTDGVAALVSDAAHSGSYSAKLEEKDTNGDEMVFYSDPVPAEAGAWYMISAWVKTRGVNTNDCWYASNVTPVRIDDRICVNFFFHRSPLKTDWNLTGGDQFFYIEQRDTTKDWTRYVVVARAPEDAAGVSMRARYNPQSMGTTWYDDFSIRKVTPVVTSVREGQKPIAEIPKLYPLAQNYPNPFNPGTTIEYNVPQASPVKLEIYNLLGQKLRTLVDGFRTPGNYTVRWDGLDERGQSLPSGIYIYQLRAGQTVITKKMTLMK